MNCKKEYTLEELFATSDHSITNSCGLKSFLNSLCFVREKEEFSTAQLQRHLRCGYGKVSKVIDALVALRVIAATETRPKRYKRLVESSEIDHDIYYNGWVNEVDDKYNSGWDPALFRSKTRCLEYVKASYPGFEKPVYVISQIKIGGDNGWEVIEREEIHSDGQNI